MPKRKPELPPEERASRTDPQALERIERCIRRDVPVVRREQTVAEAADLLAQSDHELLPVLDENNVLCGVFTERGVLRALYPPYLQELHNTEFLRGSHLVGTAQRIMADPVGDHISDTKPALRWPPSEFQLAEDFLHGAGSVVIIDDDQHVVGIIDRATFCRVIFESATAAAAGSQ